jgi:hypothetical protein
MIHRVELATCAWRPWRNGGGRTRELLAWPRADDWQLRVSVAEIEADGPFSPYPGVDRWFTVLEGAGVILSMPQGDVTLHRGAAPIAFAGEAAPRCRLIDGPTRDLNLMRRRGAAPSRWRGVYADDTLWWTDDADQTLPQRSPAWKLSARAMERAS